MVGAGVRWLHPPEAAHLAGARSAEVAGRAVSVAARSLRPLPNTGTCRASVHHAKHDAGWRPKRLEDGSTEWTSPTGHRYVEPPATYPLDHTTDPPPQAEIDEADRFPAAETY